MASFTLRIELGNAAMHTDEHVAIALEEVAKRLIAGEPEGNIRDENGNTVGEYEFPKPRYSGDSELIRNAALRFPAGFSIKELMDEVPYASRNLVEQVLHRMVDDNLVYRQKRGYYQKWDR